MPSASVFAVVTTVLWGRLYCGRICAFGALTQLIDAVVPKRWQVEVPPALERDVRLGLLPADEAEHLVDEPGSATRAARDEVLELFRTKLLA